jgi:cell division protein FtsB
MQIDANKVIEKLMNHVAVISRENAILSAQVEILSAEIEKLKKNKEQKPAK